MQWNNPNVIEVTVSPIMKLVVSLAFPLGYGLVVEIFSIGFGGPRRKQCEIERSLCSCNMYKKWVYSHLSSLQARDEHYSDFLA